MGKKGLEAGDQFDLNCIIMTIIFRVSFKNNSRFNIR